jgi:hypothetical protein
METTAQRADLSWNEAARFVNWLNTSNGYSAAYKFTLQPGDVGYNANSDIQLWTAGDAGFDATNLYRNANAFYFLPSEDEWYKAAYYSGSGTTYYDYATASDTTPTTTVVYGQLYTTGPADIDNAGDLSHYGTMGQNGNVWEMNESSWDGLNDSPSFARVGRGGHWESTSGSLVSSARGNGTPATGNYAIGFRVASVPEPSAAVLMLISGGALLLKRKFSP